jgi:hypothetical protein
VIYYLEFSDILSRDIIVYKPDLSVYTIVFIIKQIFVYTPEYQVIVYKIY